jgi:septal ring factor EnvC (AmiA/AmiB activator)
LLSPDELDFIDAKITLLQQRVYNLTKGLEMANASLDALQTQVAETNGVIASAVTLINGIAAQLAAVQAELAAVGVENATLDALKTSLDTSEQELAAAVAANAGTVPPPAQ